MTLPRWLPYLGLAAAGWLAWLGISAHLRDDGRRAQIAHDLQHVNDSLTRSGRGLDTVYVQRTDTLRLVRRHTDSLLVTDTVVHTDTVRQLVERERLACDAVVQSCEEQKANLRSQVGNLRAQLANEAKRRRGFRVLGIPLGCTAGLAATPQGSGLGGACGVKLF